MNVATWVMCVFVTASVSLIWGGRGETYMVGDEERWTQSPNYANWAQAKTFHVGDTLVFNYDEDLHSVIQVNETAYEDCVKEPNLGAFSSGNDSLSLATIGQLWYICGVGDHCVNGQKLSINVLP